MRALRQGFQAGVVAQGPPADPPREEAVQVQPVPVRLPAELRPDAAHEAARGGRAKGGQAVRVFDVRQELQHGRHVDFAHRACARRGVHSAPKVVNGREGFVVIVRNKVCVRSEKVVWLFLIGVACRRGRFRRQKMNVAR